MPLSVRTEASDHLTLLVDEKPLFTCRYGNDLRKPYLHPVYLPNGSVLTADSPPDHPEHHGLFFGWEEVNGVDFWNEGAAANPGTITTEDVQTTPIPDERRLAVSFSH